MIKIKNIFNEYKYIILTLLLSILFIFSFYIFNGKSFLMNADQQLQYNLFYDEWMRLLRGFINGDGLPLYSWTSFLGSDFFSSNVYYLIGDIFIPLLFIFGIELGLFIETIILIFFSAFFMNWFLKLYGIKKQLPRNFIAVVYALSGWATLFYGQYMFHRFYAFLPLLFLGFIYYLKKGKAFIFIIAVTLLFLQSYYLMFPTSFMLLLFAIFYANEHEYKLKDTLYISLKFIGFYLVGFLLSGFVIIPGLLYMLSNPRIGVIENKGLIWDINVLCGFIINWITNPFPVYTEYGNLFYSGFNGHAYWYSLFISPVALFGVMGIFSNRKYRKYLYLFIILILIMVFKPLSSMLHGFSEPSLRWTFLLTFYALLCSAVVLDNDKITINKPFYVYTLIFIISVIILLLINIQQIDKFVINFTNITVSLIIFIILYFIFRFNRKLSYLLSIIYLVITASFLLQQYNKDFYKYEDTLSTEYVEYFQSIDDDLMFRYYVNPQLLLPTSPMNLNQSLVYNMMSVTTYHTLYDSNISNFLKLNDIEWHIINLDNPYIMGMLGVKYYIVENANQLPDAYNFEYAYNINHLEVYRNLDFISFGYASNNIKLLNQLTSLQQFDDTIFVEDSKQCISNSSTIEIYPFKIYERGTNFLKGTVHNSQNAILQIPIPNNVGWKVILNGIQVDSIDVNGGFLGIVLPAGDNNIELYFMSNGLKLGFMSTGIGVIALTCIMIYQWKLKN